ncbi:hypothetical protein [Algiphilus sp.]|uniref:hypothetical protein n=1 Tax=Algiphilus sp. TaxID=1872431 RepID=UPI001CA695DD|nr:hypothetical protein [Algiphilus sp.]MBY8964505.1 hypothetical protein [Algiphilus acroporae]MCI5062949.1 hypothetical protein [Algiphilus sp.]MCI5105018.1 hypothetical protein [Algiphilus sp.]MCR9090633.1 hypothetical protein [Pseudomonadota bacterium]
MDYVAGVLVASAFITLCHSLGLDRERSFYPLVMIVIALAYVLLAASDDAFVIAGVETALALVFVVAAVVGYRSNLWIVVAALIGHVGFDLAHAALWPTPVVPTWYAGFCLAADGLLAVHLSFLLLSGRLQAVAASGRVAGEPLGQVNASDSGAVAASAGDPGERR